MHKKKIGNRQSAIGNRQSAIGNRQYRRSINLSLQRIPISVSKKVACIFVVFFFYLAFCYANSSADFFLGVGGKLLFPSVAKKENGAAGVGGGGYVEGGIEFFNIQTELFTSFSYLSNGGLVERMLETQIGLGASYVFSKKNIRFLPEWLAFRPHIGVFADIYAADVYKNAVQKAEGALAAVQGVTAGFSPGIFCDFPNLISLRHTKIIPTVGFEEVMRFDRVSGIYATPLFSAAIRFFWEMPRKNSVSPQEEELCDEELEPEAPVTEKTAVSKPILLPFVMFPPEAAFLFGSHNSDIEKTDLETAESALNEITRILIENPDFNVVIVGYANSITGSAEENETELLPLSLKRAAYVRMELEKRGIAPVRMTVRQEGAGEYPVADGWKNRRVEFLLIENIEEKEGLN